jgi:hypothetical protein
LIAAVLFCLCMYANPMSRLTPRSSRDGSLSDVTGLQ